MLIPVLLARPMAGMNHSMAAPMSMGDMPIPMNIVVLSILVHTAAMLVVTGMLALVFFELYEKVGLKILRHAWFNFDLLWALALLVAAVAVLVY